MPSWWSRRPCGRSSESRNFTRRSRNTPGATAALAGSKLAHMEIAESPKPPAPGPSRSVVFFRRLTSSVLLWAIIIGAIFSGNKLLSNYVFLLIMMALSGFGLAEYYGLVRKRNLVCFKGWGIFGGLLLMASTFLYLSGIYGEVVAPSKQ